MTAGVNGNTPSRRRFNRQLEADVRREVDRIRKEDRQPEFRCRVCQSPDSRERVNKLLSYGLNPTEISRLVDDLNDKRKKNAKITYWSIYQHRKRHFNVQAPAEAAYRRILERQTAQDPFADGVESLLTTYGYLAVVAQKGFETLMKPDTEVTYTDGMDAIIRLHHMTHQGAEEQEMAELRRKVGLLQQVVMEEADDETRKRISRRIDELTGEGGDDVMDAEVFDDYDDDDVPLEPFIESDAEDPLGD